MVKSMTDSAGLRDVAGLDKSITGSVGLNDVAGMDKSMMTDLIGGVID